VSRTVDRSFLGDLRKELRFVDLLLLAVVPAVLIGVFQLPAGTREEFVFDVGSPTLVTAYTSYFVHLDEFHVAGNVLVYLVIAPATYLFCALSGRHWLFRWSFVTFLLAFPFALTSMQIIFPQNRLVLGFSGINAAFFGLLCFALVGYVRANLSAGLDENYAPTLLFFTVAIVALVALPSRAWPIPIAAASATIGLLYLAVAVRQDGVPGVETFRTMANRAGYFELAGAGLGLLFSFPFVGFQRNVIQSGGVVDLYIHLIGYCLAFIVVYVSVLVFEMVSEESMPERTLE